MASRETRATRWRRKLDDGQTRAMAACCVAIPLALWELVELMVWVFRQVNWTP
jgi:hypothetical protein